MALRKEGPLGFRALSSLRARGADRPSTALQHRRQRLGRDHLLHLPPGQQTGAGVTLEDFLQPGHRQVAAGYVVYGSSTMLVYTTGFGVNGFTYDPPSAASASPTRTSAFREEGKILLHQRGQLHQVPGRGEEVPLKYCQERDEATHRPHTSRPSAPLVSDFHRNLLQGASTSTRPAPTPRTASCACSMSATPWPSWWSRPVARRPMALAASWTSSLPLCTRHPLLRRVHQDGGAGRGLMREFSAHEDPGQPGLSPASVLRHGEPSRLRFYWRAGGCSQVDMLTD